MYARRFGAMFSDGTGSFTFDRRNVFCDTNTGMWNRGWTPPRRGCYGSMKDMFDFSLPIVRYVEDVDYFRRLLSLLRNVDFTSEYCDLCTCCFQSRIDCFYFVKDPDACWHELESDGPQRHHVRCQRFFR